MTRRLLNFVTALSLLLCVAVVALWVRGYVVEDSLVWQRAGSRHVFRSAPSHVILASNVSNWSGSPLGWRYETGPADPYAVAAARSAGSALNIGPGDTRVEWAHYGFAHWEWRSPRGNSIGVLVVPVWSALAAAALLPVARAATKVHRSRKRRRTLSLGRGPACGYDLRATPGRCPECGTVAAVNTSG